MSTTTKKKPLTEVERVAQAIHQARQFDLWGEGEYNWSGLSAETRTMYMALATSAIAAMRETEQQERRSA